MDPAVASESFRPVPATSRALLSLRNEWPLVVFTTLMAALVPWVAGPLFGKDPMPLLAFLLVNGLALGAATRHLGRPLRAFRAILNVRTSWLSREIVTVSLFSGLAIVQLVLAPESPMLTATTATLGMLALVCADQVYRVLPGSTPGLHHSAGILGTGLYFLSVHAGVPEAAFLVGGGKLALYVLRRVPRRRAGLRVRPLLTMARVLLGFLVPLLLWSTTGVLAGSALWVSLLAAELFDRCEFFQETAAAGRRPALAERLQSTIARAGV